MASAGSRQSTPEPLSPSSSSSKSSAASKSPLVTNDSTFTEQSTSHLENGNVAADQDVPKLPLVIPWYRRLFGDRSPTSSPQFTNRFIVQEIIKPVDKYAPGYSKVAAKMDTDPSFLIFRKFGWLHIFTLLDLQDELQLLEEDLEAHCERQYTRDESNRLRSRRLDYRNKNSRQETIASIQKKLSKYDELLLQMQKVQAIKRPSRRYQNSVSAFINNMQPNGYASIMRHEAEWIRRSDDLASISLDSEYGWLNTFVEDSLNLTRLSRKLLLWLFRTDEQKRRTGKEKGFNLVDPYRIDVILRAILTILATVELLVPLLILNQLQTTDPNRIQKMAYYQILTIFISTLIFSASCSIFTKARRQDVFAATAAYCAVQVVFLGNSTNVVAVAS